MDAIKRSTAALLFSTTKGPKEGEGIQRSQRVANVLLDEFRATARATATDVGEIAKAFHEVEVPLTALRKSPADAMRLADSATRTAKVYERSAGDVAKMVTDFIKTGQIDKSDPLGFRIWKEAGVGFFSSARTRAAGVEKALVKLGKPVKEVMRDSAAVQKRWKILADEVLERTVRPLFDRIVLRAAQLVDWTDRHHDKIVKIVDKVGTMGLRLWDILENLVVGSYVIAKWVLGWDDVGKSVNDSLRPFQSLWSILDGIAQSFQTISVAVDHALNPSATSGAKLETAVKSAQLKFLNAMKPWLADVDKPGSPFKPVVDQIYRHLEAFEEDITAQEKALGMRPTTEKGRAAEAKAKGFGLSAEERKALLESIFGSKRPLINIESVQIHQDFRQTDPDAVAVEMVNTFEKLSEAATRSSVGGVATTHGG